MFSSIKILELDTHWILHGMDRLIFSGLHLDYCIMNEIAYLLRAKRFREIVVVSDLSLALESRDTETVLEKLRMMGARVAHSNELVPE